MTFKDIQKNHPVYILDKATVELRQGKVIEAAPHLNTGLSTISGSGQPMRDITIDIDGKQTVYTIPEHLSVTFAGDIVLATDKQDLSAEVERMRNESESVLNSVERMKTVKAKSEELLAELNPAIREKQETERRFKTIEDNVSGIRGMVKQLLDKLG